MPDNVTITSGANSTPPDGTIVATDQVGTDHYQLIKLVDGTADSSARIAGDATNGLDVDVTRVIPGTTATALGKAEDAAHASGDTGVATLAVRIDNPNASLAGTASDYANFLVDQYGKQWVIQRGFETPNGDSMLDDTNDAVRITSVTVESVQGDLNHDAVDAATNNPVKMGGQAIAHGTNPTAVAANDRTSMYFNRHGIPWVMGGHPNIVTRASGYRAAALSPGAHIIAGAASTKIVVTRLTLHLDEVTTVGVGATVYFSSTPFTTPSDGATGVVFSSSGLIPGGGVSIGDGSGMLAVSGNAEDLRVALEAPTSGQLQVTLSYYTIES